MLNPETITIIDPACGSGHILVEAYDVLKAIYLERGYQLRNIPRLILEKNLYGLDIDDRAAQLAGFALLMKARADDRRLFNELPTLNVYSLQSSKNLNLPLLWQQLDLNRQSQLGTTSSLFEPPQSDLMQMIDDSTYQLISQTLALFEQAHTLGSLIQVPAEHTAPLKDLVAQLHTLSRDGDQFQKTAATTLIPFIRQALILAMQFDAVIANPPYMGGKGMNPALKDFAKKHFPDSKADLFAMFIERGFAWCKASGFNAQVTMQSWMFLSSYQAMRENLLSNQTISSFVQIGYNSFPEINSKVAQACAFSFLNTEIHNFTGRYINLNSAPQSADKKQVFLKRTEDLVHDFCQDYFNKIPGTPVAYWVSDKIRGLFKQCVTIGEIASPRQGLASSNNDRFLRCWHEVDQYRVNYHAKNHKAAKDSKARWFPYNKGGTYRKWYGNNDFLVNWENDGEELIEFAASLYGSPTRTIKNIRHYFKESITWSALSSGGLSLRYNPIGFIFDTKGQCIFSDEVDLKHKLMALLNSKAAFKLMEFLAPTLDFNSGVIAKVPFIDSLKDVFSVEIMVDLAKKDWNNYETSWDFTENPLIRQQYTLHIVPTLQRGNAVLDAPASRNAGALQTEFPRRSVGTINHSDVAEVELCDNVIDDSVGKKTCPPYAATSYVGYAARTLTDDLHHAEKVRDAYPTLETAYQQWQSQNRAAIAEMQRLEQENNRLFIDAYGLQDELSPDVPEEQITLGRADREKDSQRLISYAIGCMMGRYSLDEPGLIYAHAGNVDFDKIYHGTDSPPFVKGGLGGISPPAQDESQQQIPPNPPFAKGGMFLPDADGIVPITDELWFEDDAAHRLDEFLLAVWNAKTLEHNRAWLAESLGQKGNETPQESLRRYMAGSFYKNHLQTYKKRPIYWLFSSGKQGAFQALVYLHRYNESTLSRMRAEYVVPLTGKIQSRIEMLEKDAAVASSNAERSKLGKDIEKLRKKYVELLSFDEKLRHYADLRIQLDLDDGVKVNYGKFGDLLAEVKAVTGGKDE